MRIAVCDDQPEVLEQLKSMLEQMEFVEKVHVYSDMEVFLSVLDKAAYYNAVLMDIDWKADRTGIDLAKELQKRSPATKIIYITAYAMEYIEDIFLKPSNLSGFLLKPVRAEQLEKNLRKIQRQQEQTEGKLIITSRGNIIAVSFRDIIYLENQLHRVRVVLSDREYWCYERLDSVKKRLNEQFLACHKSYVVNMEHILEFRNMEVELSGGNRVPVSRSRYKESKSRFFTYLSRHM